MFAQTFTREKKSHNTNQISVFPTLKRHQRLENTCATEAKKTFQCNLSCHLCETNVRRKGEEREIGDEEKYAMVMT